jgi:hypothetical protein
MWPLKTQLCDDSSKSCDDGVDHVDVDTHADEEGQGPVVKVIKTCLLSSLTLCGLYYKHVIIVNDDSSIVSK